MISYEIALGSKIIPLPSNEIAAFKDALNSNKAIQCNSIGSDGITKLTLVQSMYLSSGEPQDLDIGWVDCSSPVNVDGVDESVIIQTSTFYGIFLGVKIEPQTSTTGTIEIYW